MSGILDSDSPHATLELNAPPFMCLSENLNNLSSSILAHTSSTRLCKENTANLSTSLLLSSTALARLQLRAVSTPTLCIFSAQDQRYDLRTSPISFQNHPSFETFFLNSPFFCSAVLHFKHKPLHLKLPSRLICSILPLLAKPVVHPPFSVYYVI